MAVQLAVDAGREVLLVVAVNLHAAVFANTALGFALRGTGTARHVSKNELALPAVFTSILAVVGLGVVAVVGLLLCALAFGFVLVAFVLSAFVSVLVAVGIGVAVLVAVFVLKAQVHAVGARRKALNDRVNLFELAPTAVGAHPLTLQGSLQRGHALAFTGQLFLGNAETLTQDANADVGQ